jgi:hypothetical protein
LYRFSANTNHVDIIDAPLQRYIEILEGKGQFNLKDAANKMQKELKLPSKLFETIVVQTHIKEQMWGKVKAKISMKSPPCPFEYIAELCYFANNREMAVEAMVKIPDEEERILMLINYACWQPAVEEVFKTKNPANYTDFLLHKSPKWVHEQVRSAFLKFYPQEQIV